MTENTNTFADIFRKLLKDAHITQAWFGKKYNIPMNTVHSWAQGTRQPPEWAQLMIFDILQRESINWRNGDGT